MCLDPLSAQQGLDRFEALANSKLLQYNPLKSCFVILGKTKARIELEEKFSQNPPLLYGQPLAVNHKGTYLGDELSKSVSESISLTIKKRIGLTKRAIFEIKRIVEDVRSKAVGGILSGVLLWTSSVLPYLLGNCSTWFCMKKSDLDQLSKLQNLFLNVLLGVQHCPVPLMMWDLKLLLIPLRILKSKLLLYQHISHLSDSDISHRVLVQQQRLQLPGLYEDVSRFLNKYEVIDIQSFSKSEWSRFVNSKIESENRDYLFERSKYYKKLDYLSLGCEDYEVKPYFHKLNLAQSRIKFWERSKTLKYCRTSHPSEESNLKVSMRCFECEKVDLLSHWSSCSGYAHLRKSKNLDDDFDLTNYYSEIIKLRVVY